MVMAQQECARKKCAGRHAGPLSAVGVARRLPSGPCGREWLGWVAVKGAEGVRAMRDLRDGREVLLGGAGYVPMFLCP